MSTIREKEVASAAQQAARNEKAGWNEAASIATQKKDEAEAAANLAEQEALSLKEKAKEKDDAAYAARAQASTLESHESNIHAKATSAGQSPGFMDRVKATFVGIGESLSGAKDTAQTKLEETGETVKEKFASVKESAGEKMEDLGGRLANKGQETQEEAAVERGDAISKKTELETKENQRERLHERGQEHLNRTTGTTTGMVGMDSGALGANEGVTAGGKLREGVTYGDTGASWKETAASKAEHAAGAAADKAKELQHRAAEVRAQAQKDK